MMKQWRISCAVAAFSLLVAACSHQPPARDATSASNPVPDGDKPPHRTANPSTGGPGISTDDPK